MLYGSVIWFINELNQAKLKDNSTLAKEDGSDETEGAKDVADKNPVEAKSTGASKDMSTAIPVKKRKV